MKSRILIIDDDENHRLLYSSELKRAGYEVATSADAEQALERFTEGDISLAVVDIEMPGMDGLELLGRFREISPGTPLLINSAYSTYKGDFKSWLADGYIVKSSDLKPLKSKIDELLVTRDKEN